MLASFLQSVSPMKMSWNEFYTWVRRVAGQRLPGIEEVTPVWTLDTTPSAGFIELELPRSSGGSQAWLRFRERPAGIFFQINDAPWSVMTRIDAEAIGEIMDSLLAEAAAEPGWTARAVSQEPALTGDRGKEF